ncbi:CARDB domain-containing protein [Hymenobacter sp. UV11]|uniref:CARDB domain-containing protein n=1 Tax=Hymenobacter sp. UV11 TaxID=1849735 RepID=UPI0010E95A64|nr:CARDB domain-containing protein [Hymenobacter sp. UV11]TDN37400.1 hypothetical protein A8B98_02335 [Hymenobacter sp. UV11]
MKKLAIPYKSSRLLLASVLFGLSTAPLCAQETKLPVTNNPGQVDSPASWIQPEPAPAPDLVIAANPQLAPTLLTVGSPAVLQTTIQNIGNMRAGFSVLGYYLSADATLSSDDVLVGEAITAAISPDNLLVIPTDVVVPAGTAAGSYYLLGVADYLNLVRESNNGNNVWVHRLAVALPSVSAAQRSNLATSNLPSQEADEELLGADLSIAPNPVAHATPVRVRLSTAGPQKAITLALYTSQGQRIATQNLALVPDLPAQAEFSTASLAAGVYVLYLSGPGLHAVRRVVVE